MLYIYISVFIIYIYIYIYIYHFIFLYLYFDIVQLSIWGICILRASSADPVRSADLQLLIGVGSATQGLNGLSVVRSMPPPTRLPWYVASSPASGQTST